jgi:hypothetical protein
VSKFETKTYIVCGDPSAVPEGHISTYRKFTSINDAKIYAEKMSAQNKCNMSIYSHLGTAVYEHVSFVMRDPDTGILS